MHEQNVTAALLSCLSSHMCFFTQTALRLQHFYCVPCLSTWSPPLIMINKDGLERERARERTKVKKSTAEKDCPSLVYILITSVKRSTDINIETGLKWIWLSTGHSQVYFDWELHAWCKKKKKTSLQTSTWSSPPLCYCGIVAALTC